MRPDVDLEASANMTAALRALTFPTSKDEAIATVGHVRLVDGVDLGDILRGIRAESFHDRGAAAKAVDHHWSVIARSIERIDAAERAATANGSVSG